MVAPLVAAAGISAIGSVVGGATGGKGAKKAAKIQAQSTAQQLAAANSNRDYQYGLNQGSINQGGAADSRIAALLRLGSEAQPQAQQIVGYDGSGQPIYGSVTGPGEGVETAEAGLDAFKSSTGYATRLAEGSNAINTNAYARGMGESGATYKALLRYGQGAASDEFSRYLAQLGQVSQSGAQARGLVAGVGMNTVNMNNGALQTQADASGNAAIIQANARNQAMQSLFKIGSQVAGGGFGSSYGSGGNQVMINPGAIRGFQFPGYGG